MRMNKPKQWLTILISGIKILLGINFFPTMNVVKQCFDVDDFSKEIWWKWMWWYDVMRFYDVAMKSYDEKCDDIFFLL